MMVLNEKLRNHQSSYNSSLGSMNACPKFHANPSDTCSLMMKQIDDKDIQCIARIEHVYILYLDTNVHSWVCSCLRAESFDDVSVAMGPAVFLLHTASMSLQ